jgi:hypothetical protein
MPEIYFITPSLKLRAVLNLGYNLLSEGYAGYAALNITTNLVTITKIGKERDVR